MADSSRTKAATGTCRPPSRLQRRAPASLQISPVSDWNIAIPLLSPLVSPTSPKAIERTVEIKSREEHRHHHQSAEPEKPAATAVAFKKWQHPAAPFCYDKAPLIRPFVPV
ncbi:uncharacterized protein At4g14450, chloroplastic [Ziziphus jujuba]|uniref:Uncharacterized protein At4g14450, chloroplastic n=2 Tax=Ziziphus jujuba TaxID=326968 RepID=A0A6P4AHJ4_ZIZJJ|nr:uncharacterized protein At4g14450, chloroplastic [Ziziphus jujuba]KAH7522142.1 hypothetical protein FEM48_Zijuj07G0107000 [Ziziphus jujuba var. spinosa]